MDTCRPVSCSSPDGFKLEADADIAGVGVVVGFMATACITLFVVTIHYLLDIHGTSYAVDKAIIAGVRLKRRVLRHQEKWSSVIESTVLVYSDLQLVTGIGILISGFSQLSFGLSVYHWQIMVYLAWFSVLTHLTTLTALRQYFRRRPNFAYARVFLMGCTIILLATALKPTGYVARDTDHSIPAICLFSESSFQAAIITSGKTLQYAPFNTPYITLSILFLVISYLSRVVCLFLGPSKVIRNLLRERPGNKWKTLHSKCSKRLQDTHGSFAQVFWGLLLDHMTATYAILKVLFEIGQSMLWEIFCLLVALAWGALRLFSARSQAQLTDERVWGFGQVLAVLLLAPPFLTIGAQIFETSSKPQLGPVWRALTAGDLIGPVRNAGQQRAQESIDDLELEQQTWYRDLGSLIFGMAILIAGDILFNFPASPLTDYAWSTDDLDFSLPAIAFSYFIWFSQIFVFVYVYTICFVSHQRRVDNRNTQGSQTRLHRSTSKIARSSLIAILLLGTTAFDVVLFYPVSPAFEAYMKFINSFTRPEEIIELVT